MSDRQQRRAWWGPYQLGEGEAAHWQIGPLRFWLHRSRPEWRLAYDWLEGEDPAGWEHEQPTSMPEDGVETERFAVSETAAGVSLRALPAERPVVARPRTPLSVLPGQRARIFMSSPLWVAITVGDDSARLRELATKRLSDTWFGATTREGELCYALHTMARTSLEELPRASYRLLTPVVIENRAAEALRIERLSLPVPFLSIYGTEAGGAWSEEVAMLHTEDGGLAELDVHEGPPREAQGAARVSEPREVAQKGHLFRAFGSLLGFE